MSDAKRTESKEELQKRAQVGEKTAERVPVDVGDTPGEYKGGSEHSS